MLSDEWLSRYGLLENFNASVTRTGTRTRTRTGTGTWTTGVTAIALCTSCSRAKNIFGQTSLFGILQTPISTDVLEFLTQYIDKSVVDQRGNKGETLAHMIDFIHRTKEENPAEANDEDNQQNDDMCVKLLKTLFDNGLDMNVKDFKGNSPLIVACSIPCYSSVKFLIKTVKNIAITNKKGETALHALASQAGSKDFEKCLELLLENGFEINVTDVLGQTPLHHYVTSSDVSTNWIQFFIDKGAKFDQITAFGETILHQMVAKSSKYSSKLNEQDESCCENIRYLVGLGFDVNQLDVFGQSPLSTVARDNSQADATITLLELGANVTLPSKTSETPLHISTMNPDICRILSEHSVKCGIGVDFQDRFGSTPLHWSIWFKEIESVRILINKSANITLRDSSGMTPVDLVGYLGLDNSFMTVLMPGKEILGKDCRVIETFHVKNDLIDEGKSVDEKNLLETDGTVEEETSNKENSFTEYIGDDEVISDGSEFGGENELESDGITVDTERWYNKVEGKTVSLKKMASMILLSESMGLYFCFDENKAIQDVISHIIEKLADHVSLSDPTLQSTISLAGSVNEGTKVGWQNEFDYIWSLNHFNETFVPIESPLHPEGYVQLKLIENVQSTHELERFLDSECCLDAYELNYHMYSLINQGLLEIFIGKQNHGIDLSCIAIQKLLDIKTGKLSHIDFIWTGPTMKNIIINVDIVPTIVPKFWDPERFIIPQLPIFKTLNVTPSLAVVTKCPSSRLVPKCSKFFRISYAHWERAIIRNAPEAVRKGFILVKALSNSHLPSVRNMYTGDEVELSTYKVKTCFLHELNDHVGTDNDEVNRQISANETREITLDWAKKIVSRLGHSVEQRKLPSFFDSNKNILCTEGDNVLEDERVLGYGTLVDCLKALLILSTEDIREDHENSAYKNLLKETKEKSRTNPYSQSYWA